MPENTIGKIILEAGSRAQAQTGGGAPGLTGLIGGDSGAEGAATKVQKETRGWQGNMLKNMQSQPRWWSRMFKTMGIQVGLSGILKQSQIFTSTIGSLFQILGAFVDVILAPFVPLFIPAIRWLARKLPFVAKNMEGFAEKLKGWGTKIIEFFKDPWGKLGQALKDFWAWLKSHIPTWLGGTKGQTPAPSSSNAPGGTRGTPGAPNATIQTPVGPVGVPGTGKAKDAFTMTQGEMETWSTPEKVTAAAVTAKLAAMSARAGLHQVTPAGAMGATRGLVKGATRGTGAVVTNLWDRIRGGDGRVPSRVRPPTATTSRPWSGHSLFDDASDLGHAGSRGGPRAVSQVDEAARTARRLGPLGDFIESAARKFTGGMDEVGRALTPVLDTIQASKIMNVDVNPARNRFTSPIYAAAKVVDNSSNFLLKNAFNLGKNLINNPVTRAAARPIASVAPKAAMGAFWGADIAEGVYDTKNIVQAGMSGEADWFQGFNPGGWAKGWAAPFKDPLSLSSYMGGQQGQLFPGAAFDAITRGTGTASAVAMGPVLGGVVSTATEHSTGTFYGQDRYGESDLIGNLISAGFTKALDNIPGL